MKKTAISLILALAMVLSFVLVAAPQAQAAGHTTHCVCGGKAAGVGDHTACANLTGEWIDLNAYVNDTANQVDGSPQLKAGNYYLSADLQLTKQMAIAEEGIEVTICLNGFEVKGCEAKDETYSKVLYVGKKDATVNVCDCSANNAGKMSSISVKQGSVILVGTNTEGVAPTLNLYSGTLIGSPNATAAGGAVRVNGGELNIYKAVLKDGQNTSHGGNLMTNGKSATTKAVVNMYGGAILNGKGNLGGNVYIMNHSIFNIYGGTITGGTGTKGADICADKATGTVKIMKLDAGTTCTMNISEATLDVSELDSSITKTQNLLDTTFTAPAASNPSNPSTPSTPSKPNNPATGDSANLVVMGLGLVLGVAGIACLLPKKQEI